jgi:hypothetical protein
MAHLSVNEVVFDGGEVGNETQEKNNGQEWVRVDMYMRLPLTCPRGNIRRDLRAFLQKVR